MRQAIKLASCVLLLLWCCAAGAVAASAQQPQTTPAQSVNPGQTAGPAPQQPPLNITGRASERVVDDSVPEDPQVKSIIAPYRTKVEELNAPIGKLSGDLKKTGMGGGTLGNFVADALRAVAEKRSGKPVLLAVVNTSGLRKNNILAGNLSASDIYELLPFENALVTLDLTGEQLRRFMEINVQRRNAQSGARVVYRNNPEKKQNEIVSLKLREAGGEKDIDPKATYTIVTIDYLVKRGGDYAVLQEAKNVRPLNVTMRDALLEYVRDETTAGRSIKNNLDGRFKYDRGSTTGTEDNN